MSMKKQSHIDDKTDTKQKSTNPTSKNLNLLAGKQSDLDTIIHRMNIDPHSLSPQQLQQLQRAVGNQTLEKFFTRTSEFNPIQRKGETSNLPPHIKAHFKSHAGMSNIVQRAGHKCKCGRSFHTERGLNQHIRIQDDPLLHGSLGEGREEEFVKWEAEFMESDDALYFKLKEEASEEQEKQFPETRTWREDKNRPFTFKYGKDRNKRGTMQGQGYFFKGGGTYQDDINDLREELEEKVDAEGVEKRMKEELLKGLDQESEFEPANRIGAIVHMSESSGRAAFNFPAFEAALENSENEDIDTGEILRNQVVFVKAKKKSPKKRAEQKKKELEKLEKKRERMDSDEYEDEVKEIDKRHEESKLWESQTDPKMGGSMQSQFGRPRMKGRKFKREGSYKKRINSEKGNIVKAVKKEFFRSETKGKSPDQVAKEFVRSSAKKRSKKHKSYMELKEK